MTLHEDLSRLLDDDLPLEEATALRARIEAEPEVARAWEDVQATVRALESLPREVTPPALVVQRPARPWGWAAAGLALAAAALLALRVPAPSTVVVGEGISEVEGVAQVLVGDVVVELDGRAAIAVEPAEGVARGWGQEGPMSRNVILAGLAGAAVTVTVYEGRAAVRGPDDAAAVEVVAGTSHTVSPRRVVVQVPEGASEEEVRDAALRQRVKELTDELAAIEDELATERFAGRLRDAELQRIQGVPSEWTDQVPAALRPDAFEAEVLPLAELPGFTVAEVDCSEYPCIAALKYDGDDESLDWGSDVGERISGWADDHLDNASLSINKSVFQDGDDRSRYLIFGLHDQEAKGDVGQRTSARMNDLVDYLGEASVPDGEDVDVTQ